MLTRQPTRNAIMARCLKNVTKLRGNGEYSTLIQRFCSIDRRVFYYYAVRLTASEPYGYAVMNSTSKQNAALSRLKIRKRIRRSTLKGIKLHAGQITKGADRSFFVLFDAFVTAEQCRFL
jgi:hypothetical protein